MTNMTLELNVAELLWIYVKTSNEQTDESESIRDKIYWLFTSQLDNAAHVLWQKSQEESLKKLNAGDAKLENVV